MEIFPRIIIKSTSLGLTLALDFGQCKHIIRSSPYPASESFACVDLCINGFSYFCYRERTTGTKGMQYVSGVSHLIYWLSHCIWDFCRFILATISVVIVIKLWEAIVGIETAFGAGINTL